MTAEPRCWGGGVSHPSQLTTGLVIKSVTTSPTLAGERMLFILQVSILSEQTPPPGKRPSQPGGNKSTQRQTGSQGEPAVPGKELSQFLASLRVKTDTTGGTEGWPQEGGGTTRMTCRSQAKTPTQDEPPPLRN